MDIERAVRRLLASDDPEELAARAAVILAAVVKAVDAVDDPESRMTTAHALMPTWSACSIATSDIRHFAARHLWDASGWQYPRYYEALDVDKTQVQAILRGRAGLRRGRAERG